MIHLWSATLFRVWLSDIVLVDCRIVRGRKISPWVERLRWNRKNWRVVEGLHLRILWLHLLLLLLLLNEKLLSLLLFCSSLESSWPDEKPVDDPEDQLEDDDDDQSDGVSREVQVSHDWSKTKVHTVCFRDLGKLSLPMVVRFKAWANFWYCPSYLKKWSSLQKWSKLTQK